MTILQYPGKKNSIATWIINRFPYNYETMTYLEPFFGSGCIFFRKERSVIETINDLDNEIFNLFMQIRDNPKELIFQIENTPWSRKEYDVSFETTDDPIEKARRCIVRFWFTVGANVRAKNGMRFEIGRNTGGLSSFHLKLPAAIERTSARLRHGKNNLVQIENRSVFELLPKYDRENVFMYLDPPYLLETRKNKKVYRCEFTNEDHEKLLNLIIESRAKIIISGYMNDLYRTLLKGWRMEKTMAIDQAGNWRTECLWMNYEDTQLSLFQKENT